nr:hypothetical protein CFP56_53345 [Quercus suber]
MPYPLHLSRLTESKATTDSMDDSDCDSDAVMDGEEQPPPVPRKNSPAKDEPRRARAKLVKINKSRVDSCTSTSTTDKAKDLVNSPALNYFSRWGHRQPVQLPRLDTTISNKPPVTKSSVSGNIVWTQDDKSKFEAQFTPLSEPPSRSISYNPSPQTEELISPGTYVYNGEQMDVHGSGHFKNHPLVKNNSADVLWHGGYRSRMEHKDSTKTVTEEDEKMIRSPGRRLKSKKSHVVERAEKMSIAKRMDSGTLIVDELDKVLAKQDAGATTNTTSNDVSADATLPKSTLSGLTMPRRRLPRSDTYYDLTPPPPIPLGISRSGSLPVLHVVNRATPTETSSAESFPKRLSLERVPFERTLSTTPIKFHPQPLRSHPPNQPMPVFSPKFARAHESEITFNTSMVASPSSLRPIRASGTKTHHRRNRHVPQRAPLTRLSVDYPFYNPTKAPHAQFTSTHAFNSRGSESWGGAKRWCCCCCGGLTIVEQGVCANLRCAHERCYAPACMGVVQL